MFKSEIFTRDQFDHVIVDSMFRAYDGNEYVIVPVCEGYVFYAFATVLNGSYELIEYSVHDSYREALSRIVDMTILDN